MRRLRNRLGRQQDKPGPIQGPAGPNAVQVKDQRGESTQLDTAGTSTMSDRSDAVHERQVVENTPKEAAVANNPEVQVKRVVPNAASENPQSPANFQFEVNGRFMDFNGVIEVLNADIRQIRDQLFTERTRDFQYEPLDPSSNYVRVLDLKPGSFNDAFQCSLRTVLLDGRSTYQALSYTWGEDVATAALFINERGSMSITRNLDEALRYVRSETEIKTLWIDAVCIDQRNDVEKANQVQKMLEIYRSADQVLVWLGPKSDNSDLAMDLIARIPTLDFDRLRSALTETDRREWAALRAFYRRPWWRRIWVIQESAIATKDPLVGCGKHWMPWSVHEKAYIGVLEQLAHLEFLLPRTVIHTNVQRIFAMRRRIMRAGTDLDIRSVLLDVQWFEATNPRDKVFAVYGLIEDCFKRYIMIDYKLLVTNVYTSLAEHMMNLDINYLLPRTSSTMPGLPSWVSDWSSAELTVDASFWKPGVYNAGGPLLIQPMFSNPGGRVFVHGVLLDEVLMRDDSPPLEIDNSVEDILRTISSFERTLRSAQEQYPDILILQIQNPLRNDGFVRCLVADMDVNRISWDFVTKPTGSSPVARAPRDFWDLLRVLQGRASVPPSYEPGLSEQKRRDKYTHRLIRALRASLPTKTFFTTSWGFLGLATQNVQVGDSVAIIFGVQMPVILRPVNELRTTFKLIGPAYIHHIMDGHALTFEAVEEVKNLQGDERYNICLV